LVRKYRNKPVVIDNIKFDSIREGVRYKELKLLEQTGAITKLKLHPRYPLICGNTPVQIRNKHGIPRAVFYYADFEYRDCNKNCFNELVVEDVKGFDTANSRLKRALLEAHYGIRVRIIR